ncbi:hypothetical protein M8J76_016714 [Diaphorina citri]|nr:hypothetical protein M8J76_016714 [Diaphorina citri]
MSVLRCELSNLEIMSRLIHEVNMRRELLRMFQAVMDHKNTAAAELVRSFILINYNQLDENVVTLGLKLEAGWFAEAEGVLRSCRNICQENNLVNLLSLECHCRVLHIQSIFYLCEAANESYKLCVDLMNKLEQSGADINYASLYSNFSVYYYCKSEYDLAFHWSVKALENLTERLPRSVIVDILCQASKAHVIKRQLPKAELLILQALYRSRELCKEHVYRTKFLNTLLDYAFFLLNSDALALKLKQVLFGSENLQVAIAEDELAYALYVNEYSSGRFTESRRHAEKAIQTFKNLLPENHLLLTSAHRVKALILEEIALDSNELISVQFYKEAELLHQNALVLSLKHFGENNVQTAKHYGNIGRLYQSMQKFDEAERMQLKAIAIKEKVLGKDDYEVGLSVGHLASLYNYHMLEYHKAEKLYFRSIEINLKLFSASYSGLEYDYRGLIHVYECLENFEKMTEFTNKLSEWKILRETNELNEPECHIDYAKPSEPLGETMAKYYALCSQ